MPHTSCRLLLLVIAFAAPGSIATWFDDEDVFQTDSILTEDWSSDRDGSEPRKLFVLRGPSREEAERRVEDSGRWKVHHRHHDVVEVVGADSDLPHQDLDLELVDSLTADGFERDPHSKGYHSPTQLKEAFVALAKKHSSYSKFFSLTKQLGTKPTEHGHEIWAMKISDNVHQDESNEPNVLFVSNHHARELIVPELALYTATQLLEKKGHDKRIKTLVDSNQIYILYTMNPDGLDIVWKNDRMQRKNARGVDLNRNYPVGFKNRCGGDTDKDSEDYRGPHAFSEPETQTMRAFQASRSFSKLIDFHSFARQVRRNYGPCAPLPGEMVSLFSEAAGKVSKAMGYKNSQSCCMGGDIHYAFNEHGTLAFLVETGNQFQPAPSSMREELKRVFPGIVEMLLLKPTFGGVIRDGATHKPIPGATLSIPKMKYKMGEKTTVTKFGMYQLWLPNGHWDVLVDAPGYVRKTVHMKAEINKATTHNIFLDKTRQE